jgi:hypothetical protein
MKKTDNPEPSLQYICIVVLIIASIAIILNDLNF